MNWGPSSLDHYLLITSFSITAHQLIIVSSSNAIIISSSNAESARTASCRITFQHGLLLVMTFLDLENALGSISHELILDMVYTADSYRRFTTYIADLYAKLIAYMETKEWSTDKFKIGRGVFSWQYTLIFLIAFNPIIQLDQCLNTCGFQPRMPNSLSEMPKTNSYIYALWDEPNSEEPVRCYLAKVTSIVDDGSICLKYHGNLTEVTKPTELMWHPTRSTNKWFQPISDIIDISPMNFPNHKS